MQHNAKVEEKRRLEKLQSERTAFWGVFPNRKRNNFLTKGYPYSTNHGNNKKWHRRQSNRRFRRTKEDILNGNQHKKQYDLWWKLF